MSDTFDPTPAEYFEIWVEYFKLALDGSSGCMSTASAIIRQAEAIADAAVKKQVERRKAVG